MMLIHKYKCTRLSILFINNFDSIFACAILLMIEKMAKNQLVNVQMNEQYNTIQIQT